MQGELALPAWQVSYTHGIEGFTLQGEFENPASACKWVLAQIREYGAGECSLNKV